MAADSWQEPGETLLPLRHQLAISPLCHEASAPQHQAAPGQGSQQGPRESRLDVNGHGRMGDQPASLSGGSHRDALYSSVNRALGQVQLPRQVALLPLAFTVLRTLTKYPDPPRLDSVGSRGPKGTVTLSASMPDQRPPEAWGSPLRTAPG